MVYFRFDPLFAQEPAEYLPGLLWRPEASLSGAFTVAACDRVRRRPLPRVG